MTDCVFCKPEADRVFLTSELAYALWDAFPVSDYHALIIPRRHAPDYFAITNEELLACDALLREARDLLLRRDPSIEGFNVGANVGVAAGQSIFHCHVHLIPRRTGDVKNPRGGIRQVMPWKGAY